jgi:polyketide cyclase/dehydrase/lipid transport protein
VPTAALADELGAEYSRRWALGVRKERHVATFENTVMISRPIEQVFGFLSDFENVPRWNYAILETHKISQGPVGVGTIYQQLRSVPSRNQERFEVTAYTPPRQLEIRGQLGPFRSRVSETPWPPTSARSRNCWSRPRPAEGSHLQPGLAPDRRQGVVDGTPTGAAGVGR